MLVVGILGGEAEAAERRVVDESAALGASTWVLGPDGPGAGLDETARLPLVLHLLQALALGVAVRRGVDPEVPRHLGQVVVIATSRARCSASSWRPAGPSRPSTSRTCSRRGPGRTGCCWSASSTPRRPSSWANPGSEMFADYERVAAGLVQPFGPFRHETWNPGNAQSHVLSSFIGTQLLLPISGGRLDVGTWQRVIFLELDGPRQRSIAVASLAAQPLPDELRPRRPASPVETRGQSKR